MSSAPPAPEAFLSGVVGHVGPRRAIAMRALDRLLDLELKARRAPALLDRLAEATPERRVLAVGVYRAGASRASAVAAELARSRHRVRVAFGAMEESPPRAAPGEADETPALAASTLVRGLTGGKFENLNVLLGAADPAGVDWLLVADDDVVLPERFVDRLLGVCERLDLALAQPAQTLASHAAWPVTRRRPRSLVRETGFVEIGPVTALRGDVVAELTPFPELRFGWGLDLHWAALARERSWRMGVVDALPVRHDESGVAAAYAHAEAVEEAGRFLAERPFVRSSEAGRTLAVHRRLG